MPPRGASGRDGWRWLGSVMGRMAALIEWLDGGNQRGGEPGCWRYGCGHRRGEGGGAIEAQPLGTCHWGRR